VQKVRVAAHMRCMVPAVVALALLQSCRLALQDPQLEVSALQDAGGLLQCVQIACLTLLL
jgi:hypothetical protein